MHSFAKIKFDDKFISTVTTSFTEDIGNNTLIECEGGKIEIENSWNPKSSKMKILGNNKLQV